MGRDSLFPHRGGARFMQQVEERKGPFIERDVMEILRELHKYRAGDYVLAFARSLLAACRKGYVPEYKRKFALVKIK